MLNSLKALISLKGERKARNSVIRITVAVSLRRTGHVCKKEAIFQIILPYEANILGSGLLNYIKAFFRLTFSIK